MDAKSTMCSYVECGRILRREEEGREEGRGTSRGAKLVGVGGAIYRFSQLGGDRVELSLATVSRCADAVAPNSMSRRRGRPWRPVTVSLANSRHALVSTTVNDE